MKVDGAKRKGAYLVLPHGQPRDPVGEHVVDLDGRRVVLEDLGDGRDGVLGRVDVLHRARVHGADHGHQTRHGLGAGLRVHRRPVLR